MSILTNFIVWVNKKMSDEEEIPQIKMEEIEIIEGKELGKGGYAVVKLAKIRGKDELYAVKIVSQF